jgi:YegS/Rv2252/BmrU family lipid kinase
MLVKVIVNPNSGGGRGRRTWDQLRTIAKRMNIKKLKLAYYQSDSPSHTTALAKEAALEGFDRILVIGGDGTIADAVSGCLNHRIPLAVYPAGTGNACARSLGIRKDFRPLLVALSGDDTMDIDVGLIGDHVFVNMAGIGFDTVVLETYRRSTFGIGMMGYMAVGLSLMQVYENTPVRIRWDQGAEERMTTLVAVCNGPYYGGGLMMAPEARMNDGLLDVYILEDLKPKDYLSIWQTMYEGRHRDHPKVHHIRSSWFEIESEKPLPFHRDGEPEGLTPCRIQVIPAGITMVRYR